MRPHWFALPVSAAVLSLAAWQLGAVKRAVGVPAPEFTAAPTIEFAPLRPLSKPLETMPLAAHGVLDSAEAAAPTPAKAKTEVPAVTAVRVNYESGACSELFEAYTIVEPNPGKGDIVELCKVARPDGPTHLLIGNLTGGVPEIGALARVTDEAGAEICQVKVVRRYHVDDNEELPIEELGCTTIGEQQRPCTKADRVTWGGDRQVRHGSFQAWYEDGTGACEGHYEHGKRDGDWLYWHRNGRLRARCNFKEDVAAGEWNWWYEDGTRWAEWRGDEERPWTIWWEDGRIDPCGDDVLRDLLRKAVYNIELRRFRTAAEIIDACETTGAQITDTYLRLLVEERVARLRKRMDEQRNEDDSKGNGDVRDFRELTELPGAPKPLLPAPVFEPASAAAENPRDPDHP